MPTHNKKIQSVPVLLMQKNQLICLKKCVLAIYLSTSKKSLIQIIQTQLPKLCAVDFIELSYQTTHSQKTKYFYNYNFTYQDKTYFIHFYKKLGFIQNQKKNLKKIGETIQSTLISYEKHTDLTTNKEQWELAFDTIATPICLTDIKGHILRTNKTFRKYTKLSKTQLLQKNYFSAFFNKPYSSPQKKRETLLVNKKKEDFEISLQEISHETSKKIQLVILRNITHQITIEKKIAESAKTTELGIISSSIAHELNNPIAGIYALLQTFSLHTKNKYLNQDIQKMSAAIQRCITIINKLLHTSHKP